MCPIQFLLILILSHVFSYMQPVNIVSDHNIFVGTIGIKTELQLHQSSMLNFQGKRGEARAEENTHRSVKI